MPLYEFECKNKKCETEIFEETVKLAELNSQIVRCPECKYKAKNIVSKLTTRHISWSQWAV